MALLKFLKGNYAGLNNAAIAEGQVLICGDTGEMFVDVAADKRVKIGDFITVANIAALEALDATAVPTSRLYYVEDGNILARSNGTTWVQVNKQKTAEELKTMLGLGSLAYLSEVSESNLSAELAEKVNAASEGNHAHLNKDVLDGITAEKVTAWDAAEGNAKSYADAELAKKVDKVDGYSLVSDAEIARLADVDNYDDTALAGRVKAIEDDYLKTADKYDDTALAGRVTTAEGKIADLETASATHALKTEVEAVDAKFADYVKSTDYATDKAGIDEAIANRYTKDEADSKFALITDAYDDSELVARVEAIENDYLVETDKTELSDAIVAEKERAEGAEANLQNQINTILNNPDAEGAINSINEFTQYITDHGTIAEGFRTDIDKNKEDIAANAQALEDHEALAAETYETKTDASAKLTEAKEYADSINTALDARLGVLEAIDHEAYKAYADQAEADAIATAAADAAAKVKALEDGVVATNTANIVANAEAIATKANAADVHTKTEVEDLLTWGTF